MSLVYPAEQYHGEGGEASASIRRVDSEPQLRNPNGNQVHYLITGAQTGGKFGLYRWDFSAARSGPDPHFHRTLAESFFIVSGTVRIHDGKKWIDAHLGDYIYVPEGGIHGFRNESGEPASMLILFAPGAPREEYFETTNALANGKQLTEEELLDLYLRHDTFWVAEA